VERPVSRGGLVSLGRHRLLAAEILGGQLVGIGIEPATLMFYDPATRALLRTRPNPLTPADVSRLRGVRPAGPPPRPSTEPIRVQRRASATGVIMVAGQNTARGHCHAGQTVTVLVADTTLAIEFNDGDTRVIRRTTTQPVCSVKGQRPRTATLISWTMCRTSTGGHASRAIFLSTIVMIGQNRQAAFPAGQGRLRLRRTGAGDQSQRPADPRDPSAHRRAAQPIP
jgi:hypothetical protein